MVNEPKKRSITGKLVANVLTEREDDFTCNVTYVANRSIKDLCRIRAAKGSKYTAAEYESMCNDLEETAKEEMYSGSTVEFGFMNNSLGVDGPFIGPGATFDPAKEENLPTITAVTDVVTAKVNSQLTSLVKPSLKRYAVIASLIN
ncbi:DNA-binding domain-containing protein [Parabacteroides merdae]|uniref:DNA-binding domain-containing protein n=1 Tax=Parabacteroides merdae TaxID=46503 RepID=UPI0022E52C2B|nr:DNA-binding domain-containing protein [Parabacteroides merdae]